MAVAQLNLTWHCTPAWTGESEVYNNPNPTTGDGTNQNLLTCNSNCKSYIPLTEVQSRCHAKLFTADARGQIGT